MTSARVPRGLHPIAWWVWALGLAAAASRTTNPLLLATVAGVVAVVVTARRGDGPWARALRYYLWLGLVVVAIRVVLRAVFGGDVATGQDVLFSLPRLPLPSWAAGVQVGGPVTAEGTLAALYGGVELAVLLLCVGAANSLADPKRALRVLPRALYELGVAVVVAVSVAPTLVESVGRARRAQRLRGSTARGPRALRRVGVPVLEEALERSLALAAAMDSRGYGRSSGASRRARRATAGCLLAGMTGLCLGAYGLLGAGVPAPAGAGLLAAGLGLCGAGLLLGRRRVPRTTYRPDPWRWPEWAVAAAGLVPAIVLWAGSWPAALAPSTDPPVLPALPLIPLLAILVAAVAAAAAPPPERAPEPPPDADRAASRTGPGPTLRPVEVPA